MRAHRSQPGASVTHIFSAIEDLVGSRSLYIFPVTYREYIGLVLPVIVLRGRLKPDANLWNIIDLGIRARCLGGHSIEQRNIDD